MSGKAGKGVQEGREAGQGSQPRWACGVVKGRETARGGVSGGLQGGERGRPEEQEISCCIV